MRELVLLKYNFLNKETGSFYTGLAVPSLILQCHGRSSGLHWMTAPLLYSHCIPCCVCYDSIKIDYSLQIHDIYEELSFKKDQNAKISQSSIEIKIFFYNFQFYSFIVFYNSSINFNHQPFDQKYV